MIHDFATTPRQSNWPVRRGEILKSKETDDAPKRTRKHSKSVLVIVLCVSLSVLVMQFMLSSNEPTLDQQPDEAAKREYAESVLLSEEYPSEEAVTSHEKEKAEKVESKAVVVIKPVTPIATKKTQPKAVAVKREPIKEQFVDPDYDFYDTLRKDSWPIPINKGVYVDGDLAKRERPVYKLQAASFRNRQDAYRLLAKLKRFKLNAVVIQSVSSSGQYWYQVSVGPFVSTTKLNKAQDILVSLNMMPLKKRVQ